MKIKNIFPKGKKAMEFTLGKLIALLLLLILLVVLIVLFTKLRGQMFDIIKNFFAK